MTDPISNLRANEGLPQLDAADPKPLILPDNLPPQVPNRVDPGGNPPVSTPRPAPNPPPAPLPVPVPAQPPNVLKKEDGTPTVDPIEPTLVDRSINEAPAVGQGFTPQQELNRIVAPDIQRTVGAQQELNQRIDN